MRWPVPCVALAVAACSSPPIEDGLSTDYGNPPSPTRRAQDGGADDGGGGPTVNPGTDAGRSSVDFTVTVTLTGSGGGTIASNPAGMTCAGSTCTGTYARGTTVTLTPSPAPGSVFVAWSGGCSGSGACAPLVERDVAIGAELASLDGTWTGTYTNTRQAYGCTFNNAGNLTITATVNGGAVAHAGSITGLELRSIPSCALVGTTTGTAPSSPVTVAGANLTGTWTFSVQGASGSLAFPFTGRVVGKTLTGTWTCATCTGSFTLSKP
jgi:hypothetical protein